MTPTKEPLSAPHALQWKVFGALTFLSFLSQRVQYLASWVFPLQDTPSVRETTGEKILNAKEPGSASLLSPSRFVSFAISSVALAAQQLWSSIPLSTKLLAGGLVAYYAWNKLKAQAPVQIVNNIQIQVGDAHPEKVVQRVGVDKNGNKTICLSVSLPEPSKETSV